MPTRPAKPSKRNAPRVKPQYKANHDKRRGTAAERGYDWTWTKASRHHREHNPLCSYCFIRFARATSTELTDHLYPHGGTDCPLLWDETYFVSSCQHCHDTYKRRIESQGITAIDQLAKRLGLPILRDRDKRKACLEVLNQRHPKTNTQAHQ